MTQCSRAEARRHGAIRHRIREILRYVEISAKYEFHTQIFSPSLSVQVVRFALVLDFHMNFIIFQEISYNKNIM